MPPRQKQTASRFPIVTILLVAFIALPLAEIGVFITVGQRIGVGMTLGLILLTAVLGAVLLRQQGFAVLQRAQRQFDRGSIPVLEVFEGLCLLVAGVLLLTPGFITDGLGALLLLPPVRQMLYRQVRTRLEAHMRRADGGAGPGGPSRPERVIEAEFEEIDPGQHEPGREGQQEDRMPPPRGGWNRPS